MSRTDVFRFVDWVRTSVSPHYLHFCFCGGRRAGWTRRSNCPSPRVGRSILGSSSSRLLSRAASVTFCLPSLLFAVNQFVGRRCNGRVFHSLTGASGKHTKFVPSPRVSGERVRERGFQELPPLPGPLLHKCVEEREKTNSVQKLRCAPVTVAVLAIVNPRSPFSSRLPVFRGSPTGFCPIVGWAQPITKIFENICLI